MRGEIHIHRRESNGKVARATGERATARLRERCDGGSNSDRRLRLRVCARLHGADKDERDKVEKVTGQQQWQGRRAGG
jgi:hypothetical protein